jgi:hypothetical protein
VLPLNIQPADLVFPLLATAVLAAGWRRSTHPLDAVIAVYLVGAAASVPTSISPRDSLVAVGKAIYLAAAYAVLVQAIWHVGAERVTRSFVRAVAAVAAISIVAALIFFAAGVYWSVLGEPMPLPYIGSVFRLKGTLFSPEFFGNLLTFAAPLAFWFAQSSSSDVEARGNTAAILAGAALTFSKAVGGLASALGLLVWRRSERPLARWICAAIALVLVVAFNVSAVVAIRRVEAQFGKNPDVPPPPYLYGRQDDARGADAWTVRISYNPMSYYLLKRAEWHAFRRSPATGIGLGVFRLEADRAFQEGRLPETYRRADPHSTPFGRLAETGIVGIATVVAFIVVVVRTGLAASRGTAHTALAWATVAAIGGLLINSVNVDILNFRFFWLGVALVRALDRRDAPPPVTVV